jgi:hypothetical protein
MQNFPPQTGSRRSRQYHWRRLLALILLAALALPGWAGTGAEAVLEDLRYKVDVVAWPDAVRARLTFKSLGEGKYCAEVSGEPQGALKTLSGERRDSYRTEMVWLQGKLMPVVYREESRRQGERHLKEYRFDYTRGQLEMWQLKANTGKLVRKWQTQLANPVYDPLSALYNCRLGLLGPIREGQVFKLEGIPYPKPEKIEVRIGPETPDGRQAMISVAGRTKREQRQVYAFLDGRRIPRQAWVKVLGLGKISGELLPGGQGLPGGLPEAAPGSEG